MKARGLFGRIISLKDVRSKDQQELRTRRFPAPTHRHPGDAIAIDPYDKRWASLRPPSQAFRECQDHHHPQPPETKLLRTLSSQSSSEAITSRFIAASARSQLS